MLGAANPGQHRRLMEALGLDHLSHQSYEQREAQRKEETAAIADKLKEKTAQEWEAYLQDKHAPAAILRPLDEMLDDPQLDTRGILHRHEHVEGVGDNVTVPVAAFTFADGGPRVDRTPQPLGADTNTVLKGLGYSDEDIGQFRSDGVI